jgi:hypothetical protein
MSKYGWNWSKKIKDDERAKKPNNVNLKTPIIFLNGTLIAINRLKRLASIK